MSVAFDNEAEQLSSSASSSFISEEPMSDPRINPSPIPAGAGGSPQPGAVLSSPTSAHAAGPGGPNDLNVNKVSGARAGVAEKQLNSSPASRGFGRFVDPKDENGFAGYTRRTNGGATAAGVGAAHPSPARALNGGGGSGAGATATTATTGATRPTAFSAPSATTALPNGSGSSSGSSGSVGASVADFARYVAEKFFKCAICDKVAFDAVMSSQGSYLVCRRCSAAMSSATPMELPKNVRDGIMALRAAGGMPDSDGASLMDRRVLRAKRPGVGGSAAAAEAAANATAATATQAVVRELAAAEVAEMAEREQILTKEKAVRKELESCRAAEVAKASTAPAPAVTSTITSRQYKLEADRKYENAEYTAALELYTKAVSMQPADKMTNLKFLYGNRSAAFYMAQRYNDCIADCLEVVRLEPTNTKMVSRAARAACTMGDLQRSVDILLSVPKERRSEENETDLTRYKASLETFRHAERCFGTAEGDEQYRMLVAQYSDAVPFRIRSAESLRKQKHYMRAVEVLEALSHSARTPLASRIMSECLYLSGFEHFERAKKCLIDAAQLDDECAALLKKIDAVDDGKQNGNMNFNKKNYGPAAEYYTAAIQAAADNDQVLRVLYCNRAAAYKELGRYREGVEDCTKTLAIDKEFFKAYARRARCHEHLGDHFAAVRDYKKAMEYDSTDRELARELRGAEQNLAKDAEREKDFYYQLGVSRSATEREIKLKYRELSLRWHPDKCMGMDEMERERAEHKFKVISEAYATLVDPAKRREFDLKQDREKFARSGGFGFASTYSGGSNEYFRGRHRAGGNGFW
ncbi:DNAj-like protein [Leptomonas pyrrhocoris]|uniref:DNAj-like protein n=1 Tax=Leptomonas pyrrhocoris TaxID=157538 RepID=A0A0M9G526_LEPPY|nr:DNAj-like protein [Leptomonas pyrrhocoris]KPA82299.1 DNAj-like protein [Leptomonas pyrrhocoris]|eukprot:XP_015660738.1 DNAj-like protein [Leptomonas pyrrhocoris]